MTGSWQDFLANKFLHRPASWTSHLLGHRKISQRGSRTMLNVDGSTSAHRWTQAPSDWYKAQKGAVATVRSPVAAFESESPSVQRKDVVNAIFLDPWLCPIIVFYRMVSMFLLFSGISIWMVLIAGPFANTEWPFNYSIIFQRWMNSADMRPTAAGKTGAS